MLEEFPIVERAVCTMAASSASLRAQLLAEFTGTYFLMLSIGCNLASKNAHFGGLCNALVVMILVYAFGGISGANFNPAVSFAFGVLKWMEWKTVGFYVIAQLVGSILGGFTYQFLWGRVFFLGNSLGLAVGGCEFAYTCMLTFVVLNCAGAQFQRSPNQYYGLAIGCAVIAGSYATNGCFNPAIAVGLDVSSAVQGLGAKFFKEVGVSLWYILFELAGALLAAGLLIKLRPEGETNLLVKAVCEFLGVWMLTLTFGLTILGMSPATPLAMGACATCLIYSMGDISGANLNPAVTVAIFLTNRSIFTPKELGTYVAAQVCGGIMGVISYGLIYHGRLYDYVAMPEAYGYGFSYSMSIFLAESLFTFLVCIVVLLAAFSSKTKNSTMFGLAIGSAIAVGGWAVSGITGAALNPAITFAMSVHGLVKGDAMWNSMLYLLFELIGALGAVGVYVVTHEEVITADTGAASELISAVP
jgi:aquaporin Z